MKESLIQTAIEQYLNLLENQGRLVYIKNNSGGFINPKGRYYKMGKAGSPDFLVFLTNGRCIHLEVKNEKGRLNNNQIKYQRMIEGLNHTYIIVRSVCEVENCLKSGNV